MRPYCIFYVILSTLLGNDFLHTVMGLTPPTVINIVVVVAGARHSHLEEVRILAYCRCAHKASAGVAVYSHFIYIDERMSVGKLLDRVLMVRKRIVAHIAITIIMIPFRTARVSTALTNRDHNESCLGEAVSTYALFVCFFCFCFRTFVNYFFYNISIAVIYFHALITICFTISVIGVLQSFCKYLSEFIISVCIFTY